eukprot:TRINITY_DN2417_c0_g1_i1.p1 TRINITY_DN2417_c0_g1~~TRINITY_DN2417_c0_g1_i1.p1  ORF type:complete len:716 (+),score=44.88 TRINITY_DN2417_c0_g1_i1:137-2284(+)
MAFRARVLYTNTRDMATSLLFFHKYSPSFVLNMCDGWGRLSNEYNAKSHNIDNILVTSRRNECIEGAFPNSLIKFHRSAKNRKIRIFGPSPLFSGIEVPNGLDYELSTLMKPLEFDPKLFQNSFRWININPEYDVQPIFMRSEDTKVPVSLSYLITPHDALETCTFAYFSVPTKNYIGSLLKHQGLMDLLARDKGKALPLVYHSVCYDALLDPCYLDFMQKFGNYTTHMLDCREINYEVELRYRSTICTKHMHSVVPSLFPDNKQNFENSKSRIRRKEVLKELEKRKISSYIAKMGEEIVLLERPKIQPTTFSIFISRIESYVNSLSNNSLANKVIREDKELLECSSKVNREHKPSIYTNEPYLVFLGTGSNIATSFRGVSSIYMNIPGKDEVNQQMCPDYRNNHGILLDCGHGTFGQLCDHFRDKEKLNEVLKGLKLIYLTHYHADHSLGLAKIICEADEALHRYIKTEKPSHIPPLYVIVPEIIKEVVETKMNYHNLKYRDRIHIISSNTLNPDTDTHYSPNIDAKNVPVKRYTMAQLEELLGNVYSKQSSSFLDFIRTELKLKNFYTFETLHCKDSKGVVIEGKNWKIVYTGDTGPCKTLENVVDEKTLLIHECTFLGNMKTFKEQSHHCNFQKILDIKKEVKPWRVILTHFACSEKRIDRKTLIKNPGILMAEDHMNFWLSDAEWAYNASPLLECMFEKLIDKRIQTNVWT